MTAPMPLSAQHYKYSIDVNPPKKHHIDLKYQVETMKADAEEAKKQRIIRRENEKASRQTVRNTYRIQTHKVKKRMIATRRKSDAYNGDESVWRIMIKNKNTMKIKITLLVIIFAAGICNAQTDSLYLVQQQKILILHLPQLLPREQLIILVQRNQQLLKQVRPEL